MKLPIAGANTPLEKLIAPVNKANTVPSMCYGVTFANKTIIGRSKTDMIKAVPKNP